MKKANEMARVNSFITYWFTPRQFCQILSEILQTGLKTDFLGKLLYGHMWTVVDK